MRATEVLGRPVVTMHGDDVAQIKDVVYAGSRVEAFTLAGRGLLAGPKKQALPWEGVRALGRDAVVIDDERVFGDRREVVAKADSKRGDVLGSQVLTDTGIDLGVVTDVVLEVGATADVVGYEIDPTEALARDNKRVLVPLPETIAASGEVLTVPASVTEFVADDLAGFGAAVDNFRARLGRTGGGA